MTPHCSSSSTTSNGSIGPAAQSSASWVAAYKGAGSGLLGAIRPGFGGFFDRAGIPENQVLPLPERDAMELLTRQFAHLPTRVLRAWWTKLGHPARTSGVRGLCRGTARPSRPGTGREVRSLFRARIDRLPAATRKLLLLAALDGSGGPGALAAAASEDRGLGHLGPAERDHLVVVDGQTGVLSFRHPMIRTVLVEGSTIAERREAHVRLAAVFEDEPEKRGHHLAAAALGPDETVAAAVEAGAERTLQRGDTVGAISRFLRAADLSPDPRDQSRRLADAAYLGAHSAGQLDSSSELLRAAVRKDPTLSETLHAAVATAFLLLNSDGDAETTHRLLTVAIESALDQPEPDHGGLAEALYTLVLVCHYAGRSEFWAPFHRAMDRLATDAPLEVRLLAETLADPLTVSAGALAELDHSIKRLRFTDEFDLIIRTSIAAFYTDRLPKCRDELLRVVRDAPEGGAEGSVMMAKSMITFEALGAGDWDTAQRTASEATAMWEDRHYRLYAWNGRYAMALVAGNRGDRAMCRELCDAMFAWAAPRQLGILGDWANHALAEAALAAGDFAEGYVHACAITLPGTLRSHTPQALWTALDLVEAAVHTGYAAEARAHAVAMRGADLARMSPRYELVTAAVDAMTRGREARTSSGPLSPSRMPATGPSSSPGCTWRTANASAGCVRRARPDTSSPPRATASIDSARAPGLVVRRSSSPPPAPPVAQWSGVVSRRSLPRSARSPTWPRPGCRTGRLPLASTSRRARCPPTSTGSSPSSASPPAPPSATHSGRARRRCVLTPLRRRCQSFD